MATRIYLPQTGAAPISPAFGTWTETTGADRIAGVATRINSAMTSKTQAHAATAAGSTFLSRQYVFGPLAAQTIPLSTIKGTIRVLESAANDNLNAMRLLVRAVSADGATYRTPVLYGPTNGTVAEFSTSLRAKRLATGGATASVVVTAGDYLVIEIGTTNTTVGTSLSDSISYGDDSATDLGDNETDIAANNPFVELAATITLLALSGSDSGAGSDTASPPAVALTSIDAASGVEASAVTSVTSVSTDGGIGTDSPAVLAAATDVRPDAGTGSDASAEIILGPRSEAGVGTDGQATLAAVSSTRADAGVGADAATLSTALAGADAGLATEASTLEVGATQIVATDAGVGADAALIAALYAAADTGVGAELAALTAGYVAIDGAAGVEQTSLAALIAALEAGAGADLAAVMGTVIGTVFGGSVGASAKALGALGATATLATSLAVSASVRDRVGAEHG
ncbi:MAG: hypothetical protein HY262_04245 [Chloroflexi bacterium]|nr:hypothetical protein [Chloroflexota bacterium]